MGNVIELDKFYDCFVNALGVNKSEVSMDKRLIEDLGADSLDFMDLVYQLESAFNIIIPRKDIERKAREGLNGESFEEGGYVTEAGILSLSKQLPEVDFKPYINQSLRVSDIPQLFTVRTFYNIVESQIQQGNIRIDK